MEQASYFRSIDPSHLQLDVFEIEFRHLEQPNFKTQIVVKGNTLKNQVNWQVLITLSVMLVIVIVFWNQPFVYPIKAFVVLLHELSHGLAAILTGGEIAHIELSSDLGGVCWSRGGWRFAVLPAGYLGSMFFGGLILVSASRTRYDKAIALIIGGIVILTTILFVRTVFGIGFGLTFGLAMIGAAYFLSEKFNDIMLKFLGLTSSLYAIIDIKEDLISRTVPGSDAYAMSQELFLPPVFWGVFWIILAIGVTGFFVRIAVKGEPIQTDPDH